MIRFYTEPWDKWPRKETESWHRKGSPFKAGYQATIGQLLDEMERLKVDHAILQLKGIKRNDIRTDGLPRETLTTSHPGVILSFEKNGKTLNLPCDRFRVWQENLRAIVLALEHLRGADRYGVTQSGEQYRGWEALPPPGSPPAEAAMTLDRALDIIAKWSRVPQHLIREIPSVREAAIKEARRAAHPDKGMSADIAADVGQAAELLKKELGG